MKEISFFILILVTCISGISSQNTETLVKSIAKKNQVDCELVGFAGSKSENYKNFEKLKRKANKTILVQLLNHDSLAVVTYAAFALLDRELIEPYTLFEKFIDNHRSVTTMCGCLIDEELVIELLYSKYRSSLVEYPNEDNFEKHILNDTPDLLRIDSLILEKNPSGYLLPQIVFENRVYSSDYELIILQWAFEKNNFYALRYVYDNLQNKHADQLKRAFGAFLKQEALHPYQEREVKRMLGELD